MWTNELMSRCCERRKREEGRRKEEGGRRRRKEEGGMRVRAGCLVCVGSKGDVAVSRVPHQR